MVNKCSIRPRIVIMTFETIDNELRSECETYEAKASYAVLREFESRFGLIDKVSSSELYPAKDDNAYFSVRLRSAITTPSKYGAIIDGC